MTFSSQLYQSMSTVLQKLPPQGLGIGFFVTATLLTMFRRSSLQLSSGRRLARTISTPRVLTDNMLKATTVESSANLNLPGTTASTSCSAQANAKCSVSCNREEMIRSYWLARDGEHEYLKEVLGEKALEWVKDRNEHCINYLGEPSTSPLYDKILSILDSNDKIPYLRKLNDLYYNFWQDKQNPRGLWRRITMESYLSNNPLWETVLDFDELGRQEGESWVYKGHTVYEPSEDEGSTRIVRTMMQLSRGGADAVVMREFDLEKKAFVPDSEYAFFVPESKSRVAWKTKYILLVGK